MESLLNKVSDLLSLFRENPDVIFDTRDHGNYSGYSWKTTRSLVRSGDPSGLTEGMLLNQMIEATINLSKVNLSKVA